MLFRSAVGPWISGMLLVSGSFMSVGWFTVACFALCFLLMLPPTLLLQRADMIERRSGPRLSKVADPSAEAG